MNESGQPPTPDRLIDLLEKGDNEELVTALNRLDAVDADTRKRVLRAVRSDAKNRPTALEGSAMPLAAFLTDDDRAVRLTTAKLFVTLANSNPTAVLPAVEALADCLADSEEFYYVRARCAEALGYVAVESPEEVTNPETLADLRIGLEFDEPEVKEKLAKALSYVALGDPSRLRHHVSSLGDYLDADNVLVRYHLCTALVVIGCEYPSKLAEGRDDLKERLTDESPYVRGRAAEAVGLLLRSGADEETISGDDLPEVEEETEPFEADRVRFARNALMELPLDTTVSDEVGTRDAVRATTDEVVQEISSLDGDAECAHCGLSLPENGPPMCPRCGAPY